MECPMCGPGMLVRDTRDVRYANRGEETIIPHVTAYFCSHCDEYIPIGDEADRVQKAMHDFKRRDSKISF